MAQLRTVPYKGGKSRMVSIISDILGKYRYKTFVDVFGGSAKVILNVMDNVTFNNGAVFVYNDINDRVVNFFSVLRDKEKTDKLIALLNLTPYSRNEFFSCLTPSKDSVEDARRFYVISYQAFGGYPASAWGYSICNTNRGISSTVSKFISGIDALLEVSDKMRRVQVDNKDYKSLIKTYDTHDTVFYFDPPYLGSDKMYKNVFTEKDHDDLLHIILNIKGSSLVSHYLCDKYNILLDNGFNVASRTLGLTVSASKIGDKKKKAVDAVYYRLNKGGDI